MDFYLYLSNFILFPIYKKKKKKNGLVYLLVIKKLVYLVVCGCLLVVDDDYWVDPSWRYRSFLKCPFIAVVFPNKDWKLWRGSPWFKNVTWATLSNNFIGQQSSKGVLSKFNFCLYKQVGPILKPMTSRGSPPSNHHLIVCISYIAIYKII